MSELRIETWPMPAADLGPENPLPPLGLAKEIPAVNETSGIPDDMRKNMTYGRVANILPYTIQDGYNRCVHPREFRVAVLENEFLRATFLLELGGRLWSLLHKPSGQEFLQVNPVFQPANLALRNAWFSGGVEWNIGTIGHSPFTCSPVFAARVKGPDGMPILRLYEWERIRQVSFQIDAYLPDASPVLFVHVRIVNPHNREVPMYWWSNMAVPETPETRVITPVDSAYSASYGKDGLRRVPIPVIEGTDVSYPTRLKRSGDFFYHVPDDRRPWITALDGKGRGLAQVSTERLKGRKLFVWGTGTGGKRWQEFLSTPGHPYIEIQAGLARTQAEHLPMPAGAEWTWLESYGLMETDPAKAHGSDWTLAQQSVEDYLERLIPRTVLDNEFERAGKYALSPPLELLQRGSGWGALERLRREASGERPFCSGELIFDDTSLGEEQEPWVALLQNGEFPEFKAGAEPRGYMVQPEWRALLEAAADKGRATSWLAWLHLGVMCYHAGEKDNARHAWERSLEQVRTPFAMRNLAVLAQEEKRLDDAAELFIAACRLRPALRPLAGECGRALIDAKRPHDWLDLAAELPPAVRAAGRIRLLESQAALAVGDFKTVERLFAEMPVIDDLREGDIALSDLWFSFHEQRLAAGHMPVNDELRARVRREFPLPREIDFRMATEPSHSPG